MAAGLPVVSVKRQTAATFGATDPAGNGPGPQLRGGGVADGPGVRGAVPVHHGGDVGEEQEHASIDGGREQGSGEVLVDDGLDAVQAAVSVADDGDAAAPAQMTTAPLPASSLIMSSSRISVGSGEGATLRQAGRSMRISQPWSAASPGLRTWDFTW